MTAQDFKSSCRARFASEVGSIPTHSRHRSRGAAWWRRRVAPAAVAALLALGLGPAWLAAPSPAAAAISGVPAAASVTATSGPMFAATSGPMSATISAPASAPDTSGILRTPASRLPRWRPPRTRAAQDSLDLERLRRERALQDSALAAQAESLAAAAARRPPTPAPPPALPSALDSAVAYPIYEAPGHADPRFAPGASSDSTRPAAIAYPRPRPGWVMVRSALIPGWGQLTNGRWWKAILAAGLEGTLAVSAVRAGRRVRAAEDSLAGAGTQADSAALETSIQASRDTRTKYVWWTMGSIGLSMLDAYVDAHFKNFDVRPIAVLDPGARRATWGVRVAWRDPDHHPHHP